MAPPSIYEYSKTSYQVKKGAPTPHVVLHTILMLHHPLPQHQHPLLNLHAVNSTGFKFHNENDLPPPPPNNPNPPFLLLLPPRSGRLPPSLRRPPPRLQAHPPVELPLSSRLHQMSLHHLLPRLRIHARLLIPLRRADSTVMDRYGCGNDACTGVCW